MRLLSGARPGDDQILNPDSYLGILSPPTSRPPVIKRLLRSVSIVLRVDCLTIGFGAPPDQTLFVAYRPANRSVERLGVGSLPNPYNSGCRSYLIAAISRAGCIAADGSAKVGLSDVRLIEVSDDVLGSVHHW